MVVSLSLNSFEVKAATHVISQSLWLQYMRVCVLYSYFISFLKVVLVPLWAFTSHMAFYQKYFGGASSLNTYVLSVVFENNIKNSMAHFRTFHMCEARGFFRSQLLHLQIHHFDVIIINFPSSLISTSKYSRDLEILNILLTIRKKEQGSSDKSSQAEYGRCFLEPYDCVTSGMIWFPGGYQVTQWHQSNLCLPKLDIQIMYQLQTLLHDIALAEKHV